MISLLISFLLSMPDVSLTQDSAAAHVAAATAAASPDAPVELLLAVAYYETRYDSTSVSVVRGSLFCGPLQAMARRSRARCAQLSDLTVGYAAGADELRTWMMRSHGDAALALAHHACGNAAGGRRCRAYAGRVLRLARRMRLATEGVS